MNRTGKSNSKGRGLRFVSIVIAMLLAFGSLSGLRQKGRPRAPELARRGPITNLDRAARMPNGVA